MCWGVCVPMKGYERHKRAAIDIYLPIHLPYLPTHTYTYTRTSSMDPSSTKVSNCSSK